MAGGGDGSAGRAKHAGGRGWVAAEGRPCTPARRSEEVHVQQIEDSVNWGEIGRVMPAVGEMEGGATMGREGGWHRHVERGRVAPVWGEWEDGGPC